MAQHANGKWVRCYICGKRTYKQASRIKASRTGKFTCSQTCKAKAHVEYWSEKNALCNKTCDAEGGDQGRDD